MPADSGEGRRIVFSETAQRVWLVAADGDVERTYLVSGSKFDNLNPGTYAVQSKTRYATAFDYSGSMEYFVRFATGFTAPIGFHTVPVDNAGQPEQTKEQLGTPTSAGLRAPVARRRHRPVGSSRRSARRSSSPV